MRIVFAGTPEFALPPLRALAASAHQLVGVLTQPDRPAGRGLQLSMSPVKLLAQQLGVAVAQPASLRAEADRQVLSLWAPDLIVVVAYGLILPPKVLALPPLGCVNIHASLLPRWRGAAPIQRALLAGDSESGVTIMQLEAGLDTGPMLLTRRLAITAGMTGGELHDALSMLGAEALMLALQDLENGRAKPVVQPTTGITYAAKISKSEAQIDWSRPAQEIELQIRAFNPWPVAQTRFGAEQLRLHRAAAQTALPTDVAAAIAPGTVLGLDEHGDLRVACGQGVLAVQALQRPGKRVVNARDFANGVSLSSVRFQ